MVLFLGGDLYLGCVGTVGAPAVVFDFLWATGPDPWKVETGGLLWVWLTVFLLVLGRFWCGVFHDGLVFDGCQFPERALAAFAVIGAFNPVRDRHGKLLVCCPGLMVKDILLQQGKE